MAGLGRKIFTAGDVLTASDVQNYLMDQSVMVFAGTAARSSAVPTPSEGMFSVTTDNDEVDYYNGSAWVPALPVGAWQSYAPNLANGWANGNGTWEAYYTQIGKTVIVRGFFVFGSTTTKSVNRMRVSLPVPAAANAQIRTASILSNATCAGLGTTIWGNVGAGDFLEMSVLNASATYALRSNVTSTVPATWATGDNFEFNVTYEAA